jgi:CTP synthase (UTP-ammonia lyase)
VLLVVSVGGVVTLFVGRFGKSYTADRTVLDISGSVGDIEGMSILGRGIGWWGDR